VAKIDSIMGGRVIFEKNIPAVDNAHFIEGDSRKSLADTPFYYPRAINKNSAKNTLLNEVRAGFGLGATDKTYNTYNFLDKIN
jgi:hypothetical protein